MSVTENVVSEIKGYSRFIKFLILLVMLGAVASSIWNMPRQTRKGFTD